MDDNGAKETSRPLCRPGNLSLRSKRGFVAATVALLFNVYFVQPNIDIVIDILMDCILKRRTETPTKPQVELRAS